MDAIAHALLAAAAADRGDPGGAAGHLSAARHADVTRRTRQVIEIAALVVSDHHERFTGLALVHLEEFPGDAELLEELTGARSAPRCR